MKILLVAPATLLAAGLLIPGNPQAQQAPANSVKNPPSSAQKTQETPGQKAPAAATGQTAAPDNNSPLKTDKDRASYAIGMSIGRGLRRDSVDVDPAILAEGIKDTLSGGQLLLTDKEAQDALATLQTQLHQKQEMLHEQAAAENKKEGDAFLAANKTKEGVVALADGLQYKILQQGTGPKPTATDTVVCHYRGLLINGKEFDNSYKRGEPVTIPVNRVIKGWSEALQLMPVGSKWQLFIPPELAYGDRGAGQDIGPDATVIFEVELLSIQAKAEQPKAPAN
jgi:FKBP-type peptidyl-prolyl cis-trans isomerase